MKQYDDAFVGFDTAKKKHAVAIECRSRGRDPVDSERRALLPLREDHRHIDPPALFVELIGPGKQCAARCDTT
jgi:hypothetical protein